MCKKCHYFDSYKTGEEMRCKKCGSELMDPKIEYIQCPKCRKKGTYEETGEYFVE